MLENMKNMTFLSLYNFRLCEGETFVLTFIS